MKETKEKNNCKGITLVSLIVTIVVMLIVISITGNVSYERFKINKFNKMKNDIELLSDKVNNYYLTYNEIPVLKDGENNSVKYEYTTLNFSKNVNDNENYYIINLSAMKNIALNYGKDGYENLNQSDDVYIINEASHVIYYVKGVELDGVMYYTTNTNNTAIEDNIPPTTPKIEIIEGQLYENSELNDEDNLYYKTSVSIEFIPGKDTWSGVKETTYKINDNVEDNIINLENNVLKLSDDGIYKVVLTTRDNQGNEASKTLNIHIQQ